MKSVTLIHGPSQDPNNDPPLWDISGLDPAWVRRVLSNYDDLLDPADYQSVTEFRSEYQQRKEIRSRLASVSFDGSSTSAGGLLTHHIHTLPENDSPNPDRDTSRPWLSTLKVWIDGSIAQVTLDQAVDTASDFENYSPPDLRPGRPDLLLVKDHTDGATTQRDWKRDVVRGFTKDSRRRLLQQCGKLDKRYRPLFITLTYPDQFSDDPQDWKRDLAAMKERLKRKFPGVAGLWRMEMKTRKSGQNVGKVAPHFHLILYLNRPGTRENFRVSDAFLSWFRGWISTAWYEVVDSGDEKHLRAGTNVLCIFNDRGVMAYISKYIGKVDEEELQSAYPDGIGRCWGRLNADDLPVSQVIELLIDTHAALSLMDYFKFQARISIDYGFQTLHCFLDPAAFFDNLESIVKTFGEDNENARLWSFL